MPLSTFLQPVYQPVYRDTSLILSDPGGGPPLTVTIGGKPEPRTFTFVYPRLRHCSRACYLCSRFSSRMLCSSLWDEIPVCFRCLKDHLDYEVVDETVSRDGRVLAVDASADLIRRS